MHVIVDVQIEQYPNTIFIQIDAHALIDAQPPSSSMESEVLLEWPDYRTGWCQNEEFIDPNSCSSFLSVLTHIPFSLASRLMFQFHEQTLIFGNFQVRKGLVFIHLSISLFSLLPWLFEAVIRRHNCWRCFNVAEFRVSWFALSRLTSAW